MPHFGTLTTFDHNKHTWSTYKSRISQWFIANDIEATEETGAKRRAILLSSLADETFKLASDLAFPKSIQDIPYEDILKILDDHFTPKRHGFSDRHKFYSAVQKADETFQDWALRLRSLSEHCEFSDVEEALRDRFVMGSAPGPAREKLYEQDMKKLLLAEAIELADSVKCAHNASSTTTSNNFNFGIPGQCSTSLNRP